MVQNEGRVDEKWFEDNSIPVATPRKPALFMDELPISQQRCVMYLNDGFIDLVEEKKAERKKPKTKNQKEVKKRSDHKKLEDELQLKAKDLRRPHSLLAAFAS